jgi:hypothetical protein
LSSILSGFAESRTTLSIETYFANPQAVAAGDLRIDDAHCRGLVLEDSSFAFSASTISGLLTENRLRT